MGNFIRILPALAMMGWVWIGKSSDSKNAFLICRVTSWLFYFRCKCSKNFYGEACDEVQCFNGGTPVKNRGCLCLQPYIGPHCEEIAGVIGQFDTPPSSSFHRDLSSTVVSLFLAVALATGVYFLLRRRTQWMRRRIQARRAMMIGAGADETGSGPHVSPEGLSARPPTYYTLAGQQQTLGQSDPNQDLALYDVSGLPPPPAYHDIVKIPPVYVDGRLQQLPNQQQQAVQASSNDTPGHPVDTETPSSSSAALGSMQMAGHLHDDAHNDVRDVQGIAATGNESSETTPTSDHSKDNTGSRSVSGDVHMV